MEMTIDKSINLLTDYLEWQKLHGMDGTGIDEATRNLIDVAKKYQKIEQIVSDRYGKPTFKFMDAIVKVVEDRNERYGIGN